LGGVPYSTSTYLGTPGTNYYATQYTYDNPVPLPEIPVAPAA
jgi:hypothetical protein